MNTVPLAGYQSSRKGLSGRGSVSPPAGGEAGEEKQAGSSTPGHCFPTGCHFQMPPSRILLQLCSFHTSFMFYFHFNRFI